MTLKKNILTNQIWRKTFLTHHLKYDAFLPKITVFQLKNHRIFSSFTQKIEQVAEKHSRLEQFIVQI